MKSCRDGNHGPDCEDEFCKCYCHDEEDKIVKRFDFNNFLPSNNKVICDSNIVDRLQNHVN